MGRGRQKAKQQKIARKLKYLTTDTDYDERAKGLSKQKPGEGLPRPPAATEATAPPDATASANCCERRSPRQLVVSSCLTRP